MGNAFDVHEAYRVLEYLRDEFKDDGMEDEAEVLNNAHGLIQKYEHELHFEVGQTEENHE